MKHLLPSLCLMLFVLTAQWGTAQETHTCKYHKHAAFNFGPSTPQHRATSVTVSDSIDLIKHTLFLDFSDYNSFIKFTVCTIEFESLVDGLQNLPLDLKDQVIDSVVHTSGTLSYDYSGELLNIELPASMNAGMMDQVMVYYHGSQVLDPSGFGGFYWNSNIAYNIGVAFSDWPPSYGRAWIPCFDNFVEKSMYEFQVLTTGDVSAYCNGYLQSTDTLGGDSVLTTWIMDEIIPSYLASVAISDYDRTEWAFESMTGDTIPVYLVAEPGILPAVESNFSNLETVFHAFENWFGPYRFPRIGFNMTPVGAMEHSTNISYPPAILGSSAAEPVMAHELAHEWFGNLVTCSTPADMWLNEGWAEFLSILAYEAISGPEEYADRMRNNHHEMLHKAHYNDEGFLTMNNLPPDMTYGEHAYNKGACMAHTLRGYLADDLFFEAMRNYLDAFAFDNASSEDLRDFLNTQGTDVTDFFDDWIFQPGWAQFSVDAMSAVPSGEEYTVSLEINQRLRAADEYYHNVPVTLSLMDAGWNVHDQQIVMGGATTLLDVTAPFEPVYATLNRDEKLSYAVTASELGLESTGFNLFDHARAIVTVLGIVNPAILRIEHNWVGPGGDVADNTILLSPDRYWRVGGIVDSNFEAEMRLEFDGRNTANGNLDVELLAMAGEEFNEENLVILYREDPSEPWSVWEDMTLQTLGPNDNGYARLLAHNFTPGEYTFGYADPNTGIAENNSQFKVFPNPAKDYLTVEMTEQFAGPMEILLTDVNGKIVHQETVSGSIHQLDLTSLAKGTYVLQIVAKGEQIGEEQVVVR